MDACCTKLCKCMEYAFFPAQWYRKQLVHLLKRMVAWLFALPKLKAFIPPKMPLYVMYIHVCNCSFCKVLATPFSEKHQKWIPWSWRNTHLQFGATVGIKNRRPSLSSWIPGWPSNFKQAGAVGLDEDWKTWRSYDFFLNERLFRPHIAETCPIMRPLQPSEWSM